MIQKHMSRKIAQDRSVANQIQGLDAALVEDEQGWGEELFEFVFAAGLSLSGAAGVARLNGGGKEHVVALQAGGVAQGGGRMSFAQTDPADKHDADFVLEEGQAKEVLHLGLVDLLRPGPVELIEGFDDRKASGGDPPRGWFPASGAPPG